MQRHTSSISRHKISAFNQVNTQDTLICIHRKGHSSGGMEQRTVDALPWFQFDGDGDIARFNLHGRKFALVLHISQDK